MFFSHSDHAVSLLDEKGVWRLQNFSKTWFGNMSWVCQSLHEAFPSICELVEANEITIKVYSTPKIIKFTHIGSCLQGVDHNVFTPGRGAHSVFTMDLAHLIEVTNPLARAITCLESPHTTTADVLLFFSSALSLYKEKFVDTFNSKFLPLNKHVKIFTNWFHVII